MNSAESQAPEAPNPLAEARMVIEAERAARRARCEARLGAVLAEERCRLGVVLTQLGDGLFAGQVTVTTLD